MKPAVVLASSLPLLAGDLPPPSVDAFQILHATAHAVGASWTYDYDSRALEVSFDLAQDPELLRSSRVLAPVICQSGINVRVTDRWQALVRATLPTSDDGKQALTRAVARVTEMLAIVLSNGGFIEVPAVGIASAKSDLAEGAFPERRSQVR